MWRERWAYNGIGVGVTMMLRRCAMEDIHISFRENMEFPWSETIMERLTTLGLEPQACEVWRSESDVSGWSIRTCELISCFLHSFRSSFRTKWKLLRIQKIVWENSENYRIINFPKEVEVLWFISNWNYSIQTQRIENRGMIWSPCDGGRTQAKIR